MIERQYKAKILIKNRNSKGEVLEELIEDKTYKIKSHCTRQKHRYCTSN